MLLAAGTLVLLAALGGVLLFGHLRWNSATREMAHQLEAATQPLIGLRVDLRELDGLPAPVQRYLRAVLQEGQPLVSALRLEQSGTFNMKDDGDGWKPFTAVQHITTRRPGFVWDARISMLPGVAVHVHDAYTAGIGTLHAAVLGAVPVARLQGGGDIAQAELMRWLSETPWYPTALLPSQGVVWQAVDARSADATLADGELSVTLRFHFDSDGLVNTVTASARGRLVGNVSRPAPWQGRFWNYALRDGLRVPIQGEAAWLLPGGASPYWRGRVSAIAFEQAH
jgi:hypothetical protein